MSITYQVKPDERLLIVVHAGVVTDDEFLSFYKAVCEDTRCDKSFNILVDLRQTESSLRSVAALKELAYFMRRQYVDITERPKVAVVAPKDISFGLARMYEAFSSEVPWQFVVFRAADAAFAWLGLSESVLKDLDTQPEDLPDSE